MSFQAYIDNIKAKTGKSPADFKRLAQQKGLLKQGTKASEILSWLKKDFDLGHGHAMAIYATLKSPKELTTISQKLNQHFTGKKSSWKESFNALVQEINSFGDDVRVDANASYIMILREKKKMAVVQITASRMDIGIKLKGVGPSLRFEKAGAWNTMMTHRVRITEKHQIDHELIGWLQSAYQQIASEGR